MLQSSLTGNAYGHGVWAEEYVLPGNSQLLSDLLKDDVRIIMYRTNCGTTVTVKLAADGRCEQIEAGAMGVVKSRKQFRIYFLPGSQGERWEISLAPNRASHSARNVRDHQLIHVIARKFGARPFQLLVEHFAQLRAPAASDEIGSNLSEFVSKCSHMLFRTIEYNSNPYFVRTISRLEVRTDEGTQVNGPELRACSLFKLSQVHFISAQDLDGIRREFIGDAQKRKPLWVLDSFHRALSMLYGEG